MSDSPSRESLLPVLRRTLDFAASQAERILTRYPGYTPMYTVEGTPRSQSERGFFFWCWCGSTKI